MSIQKLSELHVGQICSCILKNEFGYEHTYFECEPQHYRQCYEYYVSEERGADKVSFQISYDDMLLPVEELIQRLIRPAMQTLAFRKWAN